MSRGLSIVARFRSKSIEPIRVIDREARQRYLAAAKNNFSKLASKDVLIDLLTDSGTGALSSAQ